MDIILIPGLWLDGRAWDDVLPHIKGGGHNPLPMTLPGQGDGGPEATLDDQLNALRSCLDSLDAPALVVGHSGHATLAWLGADRMPDKVAGVAMVGGMPEAEGNPYFSGLKPTDGVLMFPGWEAFEGPDSDDIPHEMRDRIAAQMHGVPEGVVSAPVHYENPDRHQIPVIMVCPEYSPEDAQEWLKAGHLPELEQAQKLTYVDLDSGHWPMFSKPEAFGKAIVEIANSL